MTAIFKTHTARDNLRRPPAGVLPVRAVVVSDALAERNGVGTYYHDLVQQLQQRVDHISLIAPSLADRQGHQSISLPMPGDATQRLVLPNARELERIIDEQSPHVLILPTLGPYAFCAQRIARRRGIRVCVAHHTNLEALAGLYYGSFYASVCRRVLQSASNRLMRRADSVVAMDVESLEAARRRGARRVRQMGTPVATPFLRQPLQPLRLDPPRVIFLGRLAAEKGIEQILAAARRLPDFRFSIAGDGPLRNDVRSQATTAANLDYLGWLSRSAVLAAIDAADILVLPSRLETFGTVALEALARRRLVLVSSDCGIANWPALADGLFTIQKGEDLALALQRVAGLPSWQRDLIASRGWEAVEQFNEETLQGWLNVLAELVETRAPIRQTASTAV